MRPKARPVDVFPKMSMHLLSGDIENKYGHKQND